MARSISPGILNFPHTEIERLPAFSNNANGLSLTQWLEKDTEKRRRMRGYGAQVDVEGHAPYYMGTLQCWYTQTAVDLLGASVARSLYGMNTSAARKYYDAWTRFMIAGAYFSSTGCADMIFFREINGANRSSTESIDRALAYIYGCVADFNNTSVVSSKNDGTRSGFWGGVRAMCKLLAEDGTFPHFTFPSGIRRSQRTRTPVLSDLSRAAGRFNRSVSAKQHEIDVLNENIELLALLREELENELLSELQKFREAKEIIVDKSIPSYNEIERRIAACDTRYSESFGPRDSAFRKRCAIKLLWGMCYDDYKPTMSCARVDQFFLYSGMRSALEKYLGASSEGLTAGFHIIAIDTGWNCQPNEDLQADPFIGSAVQGRRRIKSIGGVKVRAGDKEIEAALEDGDELWLPVKRSDVRLAGVQVIEAWLELTAPLRAKAIRLGDDESASRLWLWRASRSNKPCSSLTNLKGGWWPEFLAKRAAHPRLGGLRITRRIIRKTVANIEAMKGSFSHQLPMALLDHSSQIQSKMYLTEDTIQALYESKIRQFIDLWEAVATLCLDAAAEKLGIPEDELHRRAQLGLSSGLDFAWIHEDANVMSDEPRPATDQLAEGSTSFVVDDEAMENLHIARIALMTMKERIAGSNPQRWVRSWLPWHSIVEAITRQIEGSRHRVAFRRASQRAEEKLRAGHKAVPAVW